MLSGICGCTTRTLPTWNLSLRCFHIHPTMFSSHSSEGTCSWWMLGNRVEKSQKVTVTYVARPLCDMLYRIKECRQYITSWIYRPGRVPNWYLVNVLWVSVFLVSQEKRMRTTSLAKNIACVRLSLFFVWYFFARLAQYTENSNMRRFEQVEVPAQLIDYSLWSDKVTSNKPPVQVATQGSMPVSKNISLCS